MQQLIPILVWVLYLCASSLHNAQAAQPVESSEVLIFLDLPIEMCPDSDYEVEDASWDESEPENDECGLSVSCNLSEEGTVVLVFRSVFCMERTLEFSQVRKFCDNQIGTFPAYLSMPSAEPLPSNGSLPGPDECATECLKKQRADPPLLPPPRLIFGLSEVSEL